MATWQETICIKTCSHFENGHHINSIQFNSIQFNSVQFSSVQFSSVQFSSIYFPSKQERHLKNTQDGGDATKSKSLKNVASPLQLKTTTNKQT